MIRRNVVWLTGFVVAVLFDHLFWGSGPGISFFVFIVLCLAGGIVTAAVSRVYPNWKSLVLIPAVLASAAITFLRAEPFTVFCGGALSLVLMMVLAGAYQGGSWPFYGVVDHIIEVFRLGLHAALHPALLPGENIPAATAGQPAWRRFTWPVARGILLAVPVLLFFTVLLASADPVFDQFLRRIFDIDRFPEYVFRLFYILICGYLLTGVFLHAILSSRKEILPAADGQRFRPFFGYPEAMVVLGSVAILFALFVGIQFRYFFGGEQNIGVESYTYSEYARRGFGELVAVAFFSLMLFLGLGSITRRESAKARAAFSATGILLVLMVVVMLVSSFQRLRLYEEAYGFTGLRMYTHVFIVWLGVLLVAVSALEVFGRIRWFSLAALITAFGFALSLAVLNVDYTIARWNGVKSVQLSEAESRRVALDTQHFRSLSADAVPALLDLYAENEGEKKQEIGSGLSCRLARMEREDRAAWQSYRVPEEEALRLLRESDVADRYPVMEERGSLYVVVDGEEQYCWGESFMD